MTMPELKGRIAAFAAAAMLSTATTVAAYAADPLRIGVPTDLSGTYATLGEEVMRAMRFAADEANAAGGVDGHKVEYKSYDTEAKPDLARRQSEPDSSPPAKVSPSRR
jgi:branched-chain amino acid transport system substrate-binding protein